jgi:hypothetical protein
MNRCPLCHLFVDPPPPIDVAATAYIVAICDVIVAGEVQSIVEMFCESHLGMAYPSFQHAVELHQARRSPSKARKQDAS